MAKETEETPKQTSVKKTKTKKGWKAAKTVLLVALFVGLAGFAGYFYKQYNDIKKNPVSSQEAQKQENQRIIASVGKLYALPKDEEPTIFFVSDKDKLSEDYKKQEFFQKAENGDYILIYEKAKLALLYRPSEDRLVDVRPYTVQNTLSIGIIGPESVRDSAEKTIKTTFNNEVTVVSKGDAKNAYSGVTIIDISGKYPDQAKKLAEVLNGKVGNLPEGENKPDGADVIVIVGAPEASEPAPQQ
ncbi:hypothetical protein KDA00_00110 [Candidatus Saccharibacteria bacterium]|nr:hypothetical protein [Candidatus Saccharibacteria bacterium]